MKVESLTRVFSFSGMQLPDLGVELSPEQVRDKYAEDYPELATASVEGPTATDNKLHYHFIRAIGAKG